MSNQNRPLTLMQKLKNFIHKIARYWDICAQNWGNKGEQSIQIDILESIWRQYHDNGNTISGHVTHCNVWKKNEEREELFEKKINFCLLRLVVTWLQCRLTKRGTHRKRQLIIIMFSFRKTVPTEPILDKKYNFILSILRVTWLQCAPTTRRTDRKRQLILMTRPERTKKPQNGGIMLATYRKGPIKAWSSSFNRLIFFTFVLKKKRVPTL